MNYARSGPHPLPRWPPIYSDAPPPGVSQPQHMYHMASSSGMGLPNNAPGYPPWQVGSSPQGAAWGVPVQSQANVHMMQRQQQVRPAANINALMGLGIGGNGPLYGSPAPAPSGLVLAANGTEQNLQESKEEQPEKEMGSMNAGFLRRRGMEGSRKNGEMGQSAEKAARQAYDDLVREEKHISVTKVSQSTLSALGVSSFELLGFRMQDVPCLRNLALVEGKINAYIHSHIAAKRITTLYDLGCELTREEGVSDFEDLGIGPLLCHPLIVRYFSPPDEVLSITAEEVLQDLCAFMGEPELRKHVEIDEFMSYLQSKRKAPTRLHLGVRIQSLGLHVGAVLRAKKAELEFVKNWEVLARSQLNLKSNSSVVSRVSDFLSSQKRRANDQDEHLKRKRSHIYFTSDDEDELDRPSKKHPGQDTASKMAMIKELIEQLGNVSQVGKVSEGAQGDKSRIGILTGPSSCPYPSAAEERLRAKRQTQLQAELDRERQEACLLSWTEVTDFVTTLKAACANRTMLQVLEYLVDTSWPKNDVQMKRKRSLKFLKNNPGIGLLYVAVTSVKMGLWDSTYDVLQAMQQQQQQQQKSAAQTVAMAGPMTIDGEVSTQLGTKATEDNLKVSGSKTEEVSKCKRCDVARAPLHRVLSFITQAMHAYDTSSGGSPDDLCHKVCKYFNVENVEDLGLGSLDIIMKQCNTGGKAVESARSVYFLGALGRQLEQNQCVSNLNASLSSSSPGARMKVGVLGPKTNADAVQSLRNAPLLANLSLWSQWDSIFAPTLGPLLDWLEKEGASSGIYALLTDTGDILKVDRSATADDILPAVISGDSGAVAVQIVSIVVAYGGVDHAPAALLKTYAAKAMSVLLGSYASESQFDGKGSLDHPAHEGKIGMLSTITAASFLVRVLCVIPLELQVFAAEILYPAFSSVVQKSPSVLLRACKRLKHRLVLHRIGLALGIDEWIADLKSSVLEFTPTKEVETSHGYPGSETDGVHAIGKDGLYMNQKILIDTPTGEESTNDNDTASVVVEVEVNKETDDMNLGPTDTLFNDFVTRGAVECAQRMKAQEVVEAIRRDEFGVGQELGSQEQDLLARQHARMGRALHRLSQDLYSQDSHFVLELVQNADDNSYGPGVEAALVFVIQSGHIVVLNNEEGFTPSNLRALCDVGNSTKAGSSTGYIGHKGIGFKSVFRVTDSPEIHSKGFDVKFDVTESNLGFILPTIIPLSQDKNSYSDILELIAQKGCSQRNVESWNTRIDLPIKASIREGKGMDFLAAKFDDIHPSLLLFLHRLRCIAVHNDCVSSTKIMFRKDLPNGLVRVVHDEGQATWLLVRHQVQAGVPRPGISETEIALAFTLRKLARGQYEASPEHQQVFAFLPLRSYGLRFIVQGDFILPSSREEVDRDSAWNQWLLSEIPEVFIKAADMFKSLPSLGSKGQALSNYLRFVPLEGEVLGFFSSLPRLIHARLQSSPCLLVEGVERGWSFPCALLWGWNDSARKLLPDHLLKEHLGLQYLDKEVELSDTLATSLGVQKYGVQTLVAFMKSLCQDINGVEIMGLEWVRDWLISLHDCLLAEQQLFHPPSHQERDALLAEELQNLRFIPLANGSLTAMVDGPVWFTSQQAEQRDGTIKPLGYFPLLYAELRTVHPILLHNAVHPEADASGNSDASGKIFSMLHQLGVRPMSAHHVLRSHVLPVMAEQNCMARETSLLLQYLGYAKWHLESGCNQCTGERAEIMDQLRSNAVIITNNGQLRAGCQEAIHFGATMGNPFNARLVLDGTLIKWNEVDGSYLQLALPDQVATNMTSWRKFLAQLRVTDFVQVLPVEKVMKDKGASVWKDEDWKGDGETSGCWVLQDWESPELVEMITAICGAKKKQVKKGGKALKKAKLCSLLLSVIDKLWVSDYASSWRATYRLSDDKEGHRGETMASWVLQLQKLKWVKSSLDKQLHIPTALFQRCDAVCSILGSHAAYVDTQIQCADLLRALGLKTKVTVDDCLSSLELWAVGDQSFEASVAQMARLYLFLAEQIGSHMEKVLAVFKLQPAIFLPWTGSNAREEVVKGSFHSLDNVCWADPTGALTLMLSMEKSSAKKATAKSSNQQGTINALSVFYPELETFFVKQCLVQERPDFYSYSGILQRLAALTSPSSVLDQVMEVLAAWSWDVESEKVSKVELEKWKARLQEADCTVLPTTQDKWVSLNSSMGLVCVCDDEKIRKEFSEESDKYHFLCMDYPCASTKLSKSSLDKRANQSVQLLYTALGIPLLSQAVKREVIVYGSQDAAHIEALMIWVLPYAQRYIRQHHLSVYNILEKERIRKRLKTLRYTIVNQLFFRYSLQSGQIRSHGRVECGCVLEDNTLYVATAQCEDHCMLYAELSRLFFSGQPNQQFANFLHLITLMASLGSPENDVESYIVNTQGVQPLPHGIAPWKAKPTIPQESNCLNASSSSKNGSSLAEVYIQRHAKLEESLPRKSKATEVYSGWPPRSWIPLPTVKSTAMSSVVIEECGGILSTSLKRDPTIAATNQKYSGKFIVPKEVFTSLEADPWHKNGESLETANGPDSVAVVPRDSHDIADIVVQQTLTREIVLNPATEQQQMTGWTGEEVAYQYLIKKHGAKRVKWVNEDGETGAAFDMIVETKSGQQEFVEVKTTRSQDKDWFEISTREWEFAQVHGDLYTVLRVILPTADKSYQIIRFSNPVKLCRERVIQLAVILPFSNSLSMSGAPALQIAGNGSPQGIQVATYKVTLPDTEL